LRSGDDFSLDEKAEGMIQVGWGYDSHRFVRGRPLVLGGVTIPFEFGLKGHSDADVILHAVIDALLGAAGLGDIGGYFPDTDPRYRGVSSLKLLAETARLIKPGFRVVHLDITLLAEVPKVGPYKQRMRAKIAHALGVSVEQVNVKAKTNEGMGFIGKKEGLAAAAVATVDKSVRKRRRAR
jgi:2-C-methyl-D-erythritol 2,4-cyclodiphosphate synthase